MAGEKNDTLKYRASCECGQLHIDIKGSPMTQLVCHCEDCRSLTHQPFTEVVFFSPRACTIHGEGEEVTMKGGSGKSKTYVACKQCGTPLYATVDVLNGAVGVIAGRLDAFTFRPFLHVWTSQKADDTRLPWLAIKFSKAPPIAAGNLLRKFAKR